MIHPVAARDERVLTGEGERERERERKNRARSSTLMEVDRYRSSTSTLMEIDHDRRRVEESRCRPTLLAAASSQTGL